MHPMCSRTCELVESVAPYPKTSTEELNQCGCHKRCPRGVPEAKQSCLHDLFGFFYRCRCHEHVSLLNLLHRILEELSQSGCHKRCPRGVPKASEGGVEPTGGAPPSPPMKFSRDAAIPRIPAPHLLKQGQLQLAGASFRDEKMIFELFLRRLASLSAKKNGPGPGDVDRDILAFLDAPICADHVDCVFLFQKVLPCLKMVKQGQASLYMREVFLINHQPLCFTRDFLTKATASSFLQLLMTLSWTQHLTPPNTCTLPATGAARSPRCLELYFVLSRPGRGASSKLLRHVATTPPPCATATAEAKAAG